MENTKEQEMAKIRKDLKEMIVRDLSLEDVNPADIKDNGSSSVKGSDWIRSTLSKLWSCCSAISAWK